MSTLLKTDGNDGPMSAGGLFDLIAVQASAYTANPGEFVPADTTSGAVTVTLPSAPAHGTMVAVKMIKQGSTNAVTIAAGGADAFNKSGGSTSLTLGQLNQGVVLQYKASIGVWYVLADDLAAGSLGTTAFTGVVSPNAGTDSAGSAPILTAVAGTNGGPAVQLTDTARDYMVYLEIGTAGTAWIVSMGHTSGATDVTIHASGVATAGQVLSFRLPAGWFFLWSATTATLAQSVAVGC